MAEISWNLWQRVLRLLKSFQLSIDFDVESANCFNCQIKWFEISFKILRLGLRKVDLSSHRISKVESFAFAFDSPSSESLTIDLSHNDLNDKSFDVESFEVNERITDLRLSANPKLKVLSESVFVPFLMNRRNASVENQIDLTGTQLSCCDKNVWLFQREASLHLFNKLKNVLAEDGQDFWRHNWLECSKRLCG